MTYVYAILDASHSVAPEVCGIGGKPVSFIAAAGLEAACSAYDGAQVRPTAQNVLEHERVVEELMRHAVLLPARFGTALPNERDVRDLLHAHDAELRQAIERVRGCDELGVRVLQTTSPDDREEDSPPKSGQEYMLRRMAAERLSSDARRRGDAIHQNLSTLAMASTHGRAAGFLLSGAYLVPSDRVDLFRSRVTELAAVNADLRLLCTGPWPPYNFAPQLKGREVSHAG